MPRLAGSQGAPPLRLRQRLATAAARPTPRQLVVAALVAIVAAGGWLRLSGADWDSGLHLHPDERYLSQVEDNIRWPSSVGQYFDVHASPLSPFNTEQGRSYLYGTMPLFATKAVAGIVGQDDYSKLNLVGRRLSALVDTGSIVLVFLLALLLLERYGRRLAGVGALTAAALYAFTVTVIQAAHFFTTDSWLVFFGLLTFYLAARTLRSPPGTRFRPLRDALIGVSLGLTVACKVSGVLIAIPVLIALLGEAIVLARGSSRANGILRACAGGLTIVVAAYVAFRAVSPYAFASSSWLDVSINPAFRDALQTQQDAIAGKFLYPPSYQWLLAPRIWSPFENLFLWQLGPALAGAALVGLAVLGFGIVKPVVGIWGGRRNEIEPELQARLTIHLMLLSFVLLIFFYFGSEFGHTGRYLLPLVPFAAVAASAGIVALLRSRPAVLGGVAAVIVTATGLYALAFHTIYTRPNTRVAANEWIAKNIAPGSTILNENWDDPLPVGSLAERFTGNQLTVFDPDDATKLRKLYDGLSASQYYFLSSPRAWRTIGRLPDRFPIMTRFYRQLFANRLGFTRVIEISSEPELLGIKLHDIGAEEAFWVYDHPPVRIYRKVRPLSWDQFRAALCSPPQPPGCQSSS